VTQEDAPKVGDRFVVELLNLDDYPDTNNANTYTVFALSSPGPDGDALLEVDGTWAEVPTSLAIVECTRATEWNVEEDRVHRHAGYKLVLQEEES
jgi:hypothetical protein